MEVRTDSLKPHLTNAQIYNDSADDDLVESIHKLGIVQPIVVTQDMTIISGHRRWSAAIQLGLESVPVRVVDLTDRFDIIVAMIAANKQRIKTREQVVKEIETIMYVEEERAIQRRNAGLLQNQRIGAPEIAKEHPFGSASESHPSVGASCPNGQDHESGPSGRISEIAAKAVGRSARSVKKDVYVFKVTNKLVEEGRIEEATRLRIIQNKTNPTRAEKEAKAIDGPVGRQVRKIMAKTEEQKLAKVQSKDMPIDISSITDAGLTEQEDRSFKMAEEVLRNGQLLPCIDCECTDMSVIQGSVSCNGCGMIIQWDDTNDDRATQRWNRIAQKCNRRTS